MENEKTKIYFVPLRYYGWGYVECSNKSVQPDPSLGLGFLPVFKSKATLKKYYPDAQISVFRIVEKETKND